MELEEAEEKKLHHDALLLHNLIYTSKLTVTNQTSIVFFLAWLQMFLYFERFCAESIDINFVAQKAKGVSKKHETS